MTGFFSRKILPSLPTLNKKENPVDTKFLINPDGLAMVRYYEGLYLKAEPDAVGVATIGYGRILYDDGSHVQNGDTCTEDQANQWLLEDLEKDGGHYVRAWTSGLNENQFSALTSFAFNRGAGRLRELLGMGKDPMSIAKNILHFDFAGTPDNHLLGLSRRRRSECALFSGGDWKQFTNWRPE